MKLRPIIKKKIRKSGFEDAFFVLVVIFTMVIFILILAKVWGEIKDPLDEGLTGSLPAGSGVNITANFATITSTITLFDKLFPLILIGLFALVLIGGAMYANHPIMIFVGIIILAVAILLAVIFSNVYHQIAETEEFESTTDSFPISDKFMEFLPYIIFLMFMAIGATILWARSRAGVGVGGA